MKKIVHKSAAPIYAAAVVWVLYALPLIQGEPDLPKVDSLPRFAKLKKILAK